MEQESGNITPADLSARAARLAFGMLTDDKACVAGAAHGLDDRHVVETVQAALHGFEELVLARRIDLHTGAGAGRPDALLQNL